MGKNDRLILLFAVFGLLIVCGILYGIFNNAAQSSVGQVSINNNQPTAAGTNKLVFETNVSGQAINNDVVKIPAGTQQIRIEYINMTFSLAPAPNKAGTLDVISLNTIAGEGQDASNYDSNRIDEKFVNVNDKTPINSNITMSGANVQSIIIRTTYLDGTIRVYV